MQSGGTKEGEILPRSREKGGRGSGGPALKSRLSARIEQSPQLLQQQEIIRVHPLRGTAVLAAWGSEGLCRCAAPALYPRTPGSTHQAGSSPSPSCGTTDSLRSVSSGSFSVSLYTRHAPHLPPQLQARVADPLAGRWVWRPPLERAQASGPARTPPLPLSGFIPAYGPRSARAPSGPEFGGAGGNTYSF